MSDEAHARLDLRDLGIALFVVLLAASLRLNEITEIPLTHFDEGGYAMSAQAVAEDAWPERGYPTQHYLAPPLLFMLTGLVMKATGSIEATMLIGTVAVLGVLTVLLVFVLARQWLGRGAALAAALMLALSGFHVSFSRIGLTDVPFLFFLLLSLWLFSIAERRRSMGMAVLTGIAIGLAWNTKYHGWLGGVIGAAALLPALLAGRREDFVGGLKRFAVATLVACLCYLPWFLHVCGEPGGYPRLMEEHSAFLHMPGKDTITHAIIHFRAQLLLDTYLGRAAPLVALLFLAVSMQGLKKGLLRTLIWLPVLLAGADLLGQLGLVALLALAGLPALIRQAGHARWLLLFLLLVFTLLTPLYYPYVRLLLPWFAAIVLVAGWTLQRMAARPLPTTKRELIQPLGLGLVFLCIWIAQRVTEPPSSLPLSPGHEVVTGFEQAASEIAAALPEGARVDVIGEPAVVFELRRHGIDAWHVDDLPPVETLDGGVTLQFIEGWYGFRMEHVALFEQQLAGSADVSESGHAAGVGYVRALDDDRDPRRAHEIVGSRRYRLRWTRIQLP